MTIDSLTTHDFMNCDHDQFNSITNCEYKPFTFEFSIIGKLLEISEERITLEIFAEGVAPIDNRLFTIQVGGVEFNPSDYVIGSKYEVTITEDSLSFQRLNINTNQREMREY